MEKKENRELRMYFLVMYNLSPIQQGIQCGHCIEEYVDKYGQTELYKEYRKHKTWIVLNGGTSNDGLVVGITPYVDNDKLGTMELYEQYLIGNTIPFGSFREPDLNNSLSALCFICDNRVFDWINYPNFENYIKKYHWNHNISMISSDLTGTDLLINLNKLEPPYNKIPDDVKLKVRMDITEEQIINTTQRYYKDWIKFIGGEQNAKLKELIYGKKLA